MSTLSAKRVHLRPVYSQDYSLLADWDSDPIYSPLWSLDRRVLSHEETVERVVHRLQSAETRFMVVDNVSEEVTGSVWAYEAHPDDGYCFVAVYIAPDFVGHGRGVEAAILLLDYLFGNFGWLHKIYTDVYSYNAHSLRLHRKAGFHEEGCFHQHRFYSGSRWDMFRFAFYRQQWEENRDVYLRPEKREPVVDEFGDGQRGD